MLYFCRNRAGCGFVRHVRSDADDDAGHVVVAGDRLDHRPLFGRVVHERAHAAEHRLEDRQADRRVALGRRHENRARRGRARAVVRVVVAVAEEEAVVVVGGVLARCSRRAPGSSALRRRASRARRRASAAARRRASDRRPKTSGSRSCFTVKRRTGDAVDAARRRPAARCAT